MSCVGTIFSVAIPGPQGLPGADGADGAAGVSAFTLTTASFIMPAEGATVSVAVASSAWAAVGEIVWVYVGGSQGHFQVAAIPDSTHLTLTNIEDTASNAYTSNSAPTTVFATGAKVVPAGLQGPAGNAAGSAPNSSAFITQTPDAALSGEQALSLLATGMLKNTTGTGVLSIGAAGTDYYAPGATDVAVPDGGTGSSTAAGARTNLGVAIGTDVQAQDATLQSIAALGTAANKIAYTTGVDTWAETGLSAFMRTVLDDNSQTAAWTTLGLLPGYGIIAFNTGTDHNVAGGDTALVTMSHRFIIDKMLVENASGNFSVAPVTAGLFTAAGGAGVTLAADQTLAPLTAVTKFQFLTLQAICSTDIRTEATLYYRVGTPFGGAASADIFLLGWKLDT